VRRAVVVLLATAVTLGACAPDPTSRTYDISRWSIEVPDAIGLVTAYSDPDEIWLATPGMFSGEAESTVGVHFSLAVAAAGDPAGAADRVIESLAPADRVKAAPISLHGRQGALASGTSKGLKHVVVATTDGTETAIVVFSGLDPSQVDAMVQSLKVRRPQGTPLIPPSLGR
jgi:hypothetical protein